MLIHNNLTSKEHIAFAFNVPHIKIGFLINICPLL